MVAPDRARQPHQPRAVGGDEAVERIARRGERRNAGVERRRNAAAGSERERAEHGVGARNPGSVLVAEVHGPREFGAWDLGEAIRHVLVGHEVDERGERGPPAIDPQPAELARAVPDQQRLRWGFHVGHCSGALRDLRSFSPVVLPRARRPAGDRRLRGASDVPAEPSHRFSRRVARAPDRAPGLRRRDAPVRYRPVPPPPVPTSPRSPT